LRIALTALSTSLAISAHTRTYGPHGPSMHQSVRGVAITATAAAGRYPHKAALLGNAEFGSPSAAMDTRRVNAQIQVGQAMRAAGCHERNFVDAF
jgi:hypothetical protein